jgi:hypothetical protein
MRLNVTPVVFAKTPQTRPVVTFVPITTPGLVFTNVDTHAYHRDAPVCAYAEAAAAHTALLCGLLLMPLLLLAAAATLPMLLLIVLGLRQARRRAYTRTPSVPHPVWHPALHSTRCIARRKFESCDVWAACSVTGRNVSGERGSVIDRPQIATAHTLAALSGISPEPVSPAYYACL